MKKLNQDLLDFIKKTPTAYHCAENVGKILTDAGFVRREVGKENIAPGGKYFTVFADSAVIAYRIPSEISEPKLKIVASHGDSPAFKLKPSAEQSFGEVVRLVTEKYGGMIYSSWLDRPLKIAGRIIVRDGEGIKSMNVMPKGFAVIPNTSIHQNRKINSGFEYNPQTDLQALWSEKEKPLMKRLSEASGVDENDILDCDLFLYNPDEGMLWGGNGEFISAPRLDDLQCVYSALCGFLDATPNRDIQVFAVFDGEEVGSRSASGADSLILTETVREICEKLGISMLSLALNGLMISADNAHALHPNHPELSDPVDRPRLNGGVTIKYNANQNYMTNAKGAALVKELCRKNGIKLQSFVNRSDMPGGSTLGSISSTQLPISGVDVGIAQLAMHSSFETSGAEDTEAMRKFISCFFSSSI